MKLSQSTLSLIEETIKKAIAKFACGCEQTIVTDIHLQPVQSSGDLLIFDDDDNELAHATVEEWMTYEGTIMKPYSFVLVDEEKETIAELLLMDDDTLLVNDELLKGLDEELDDFLKKLLE